MDSENNKLFKSANISSPNMRQEIENWWKQALADKRKADVLFDTSNYDGAVFYYSQTLKRLVR